MERCNPTNTIIFHGESSECFEKVASFRVHCTVYAYKIFVFAIVLSNKSKASIDETVARLSIIAYEMYFSGIFTRSSIRLSSFTLTLAQGLKHSMPKQVDSISIVTPAHAFVFSVAAL